PLYRAVPLQLDASILPARRGARIELGRHWPADLQPELQRCRLCRRGRTLLVCGRRDESRWLVVARCRADQQGDTPPHPEGNADKKAAAVNRSRFAVAYSSYACLTCFSRPGSINSPLSKAIGALR